MSDKGQTLEELAKSGWSEPVKPEAKAPAPPAEPSGFATVRAALDAYDAKFRGTTAGKVDTFMNTPLGHPTGVDAVDEMTSPSNLAQLAILGVKPATQLALKAVSGLLGSVGPEVAADVVGLLSPRAAHALRIVGRVAGKAAAVEPTAAPAPTPPEAPPTPKVPASQLSDLDLARQEVAAGRLNPGVLKGLERQAAVKAAKSTPVAAPAQPAPPVATPAPAVASAPPVEPVATPAPASPAGGPVNVDTAIAAAKAAHPPVVMPEPATAASFDPAKGGTLFHGTTTERLASGGPRGETYLTTTPTEAQGYAKGLHAPGESRGTPTVVATQAKPGVSVDLNSKIMQAMENDDFSPEWLDKEIAAARKSGARYVTYEHPSFSGDGPEQNVIVSLHPAEDLSAMAPTSTAEPFYVNKALNELAIGARRAKIKLTGAEERAAVDTMRQGAAAPDAIKTILTQRLAALPGTMTDAEVAAERATKGWRPGPR